MHLQDDLIDLAQDNRALTNRRVTNVVLAYDPSYVSAVVPHTNPSAD